MTTEEEWRSASPTSGDDDETPTFASLDECVQYDRVEPGQVVWRRAVTYGDWTPVVVPESIRPPMRDFSGICAVEGRKTEDGRLIDMGAMAFRDDATPLMAKIATEDYATPEPVGRIDHVIRHGMYVGIHGKTTLEPGVYGVGVDLVDIVTKLEPDGTLRFTHCRLMGVTISDNPVWPQHCKIEVEQ